MSEWFHNLEDFCGVTITRPKAERWFKELCGIFKPPNGQIFADDLAAVVKWKAEGNGEHKAARYMTVGDLKIWVFEWKKSRGEATPATEAQNAYLEFIKGKARERRKSPLNVWNAILCPEHYLKTGKRITHDEKLALIEWAKEELNLDVKEARRLSWLETVQDIYEPVGASGFSDFLAKLERKKERRERVAALPDF